MAAHVHDCTTCGALTEGVTYYLTYCPREPTGVIPLRYLDSNPPTFCSPDCRTGFEATHPHEPPTRTPAA